MPIDKTKRSPGRSCVAIIKIHHPHFATIGRQPFEAIADEPLFGDRQPTSRVAARLRSLVEPDGPKRSPCRRITFPAGLVPHTMRLLQERSYRVTIKPAVTVEHFYPHRHPSDPDWHSPEFLRRAYDRPRALGLVPKHSDRIRLVAKLCQQFPVSWVLVVVKNLTQAESVGNVLQELTDRRVTVGSEPRHGDGQFLHVDAIGTLTGRSVRDWRFVVVLDAELLLSLTTSSQLIHMFGSILIGFLTRHETKLHEMDRGLIEGMFGPVIYRSDDEANFTTVSVAWLSAASYPADQWANQLERKRILFWQNTVRNRRIAEAALAFQQNDEQLLRKLGLDEPARTLRQSLNTSAPTVAVVVENVEHGRELCKLLPDWQVEHSEEGIGRLHRYFIEGKSIMTLSRTQQSVLNTDVVIYAAGTGNQWIDNLGPQFVSLTEERMLVVDIADDGDQQALDSVRARAADYRHRGWELTNQPNVRHTR